ncbi:hypothetical protein [Shimazuella kribbensis]|uniref:hypothetical protein n=1 Tax=Shimazuella kribbensis TaxID=139808 RepID=UPI00048F1D50|nr:hypothetical protein [Shimazuella kribbensis]
MPENTQGKGTQLTNLGKALLKLAVKSYYWVEPKLEELNNWVSYKTAAIIAALFSATGLFVIEWFTDAMALVIRVGLIIGLIQTFVWYLKKDKEAKREAAAKREAEEAAARAAAARAANGPTDGNSQR